MTSIDELKDYLRKISINAPEMLPKAWENIIKMGYAEIFPKICIDNDPKIELYNEFISNKNNNIVDRYALYWSLIVKFNEHNFIENNQLIKLYTLLLNDSLDYKINLNEDFTNKKRYFIFVNNFMYLSHHAPSVVTEKIFTSLKNKVDEIYIISCTAAPFKYPLGNVSKFLERMKVEQNKLYDIDDKVKFVEFSGYITDSQYLDFMNNMDLELSDKFILVGHSCIHFDIINSKNKIVFPTSSFVKRINTAEYLLYLYDNTEKNISNKTYQFIKIPNDLTRENQLDFSPKNISIKDVIVIAIVGNRLEEDLKKEFFDILETFINNTNLNIRFKVIGEFNKLNRISDNLINKIDFTGFIENLQEYFLNNIHFFLNPNRKGGGHSSMLAINVGVPVLTLPYGDVYENLEKKYHINNFEEINLFINNYINNSDGFKDKIDTFNKELCEYSAIKFNEMINKIVDL